jgi:hypothetical protein
MSDSMAHNDAYYFAEDTYNAAKMLIKAASDPNTSVILLSDREYSLLTRWYEDLQRAKG